MLLTRACSAYFLTNLLLVVAAAAKDVVRLGFQHDELHPSQHSPSFIATHQPTPRAMTAKFQPATPPRAARLVRRDITGSETLDRTTSYALLGRARSGKEYTGTLKVVEPDASATGVGS